MAKYRLKNEFGDCKKCINGKTVMRHYDTELTEEEVASIGPEFLEKTKEAKKVEKKEEKKPAKKTTKTTKK